MNVAELIMGHNGYVISSSCWFQNYSGVKFYN
jgi:hypothetical protein